MYLIFDCSALATATNFKANFTDTEAWPRLVHISWILIGEDYKIIEDYPKYRVSNYGNIQSSWIKNEWRTLKFGKHDKGYFVVGLSDGINKVKTFLVHRLVAKHFIEKPDEEGL